MFFVYIIQSLKTGRFYIGCTKDLEKRLRQHGKGENVSTRFGCPWVLVCYRKFLRQQEAYGCEKLVKSYKGGNGFKKIINGEVAEWSKAARC
ncbi:MAG: GIY-YIG nuclease family protein [Candidatus Magasanikbacteria bacterium]|nr:GIY-YIG nuclease family protein [Candidatus Magasanikbacteria bacterium]